MVGKAEWMTPAMAEADNAARRQKKQTKRAKKPGKAKAAAAPVIPLPGRANPRFVVTSLSAQELEARDLYEKRYCARGEMENRIKECQLDLFADRTSSHTMRANQLRLWLASFAHVLLSWPPAAPTHCARNRCYAGGPPARGRRLLGALSPILSWTVGPWSTPDCRQSVRWAVEHACKSSLE